jgi:hypothetical protein
MSIQAIANHNNLPPKIYYPNSTILSKILKYLLIPYGIYSVEVIDADKLFEVYQIIKPVCMKYSF